MDALQVANSKLDQLAAWLIDGKKPEPLAKDRCYKVGVDLGTSSIVLVVVDDDDQPVFAASEDANVVRDGLVVNYGEAVAITKRLKAQAEAALQVSLLAAAGAIPPGTIGNNKAVVGHVLEAADMAVVGIFDEPTAAAVALGVQDGVIVDVGGGTTGISVLADGEVVFAGDEPTGGTQITLVLAGRLGLTLAAAEAMKRLPAQEETVFPIIQPVIDKVATITEQFIQQAPVSPSVIYLVGGATDFSQSVTAFQQRFEISVVQPHQPRLVTPLGIAMSVAQATQPKRN
ncbi:ethanolamine utilization protein EutJ [Lacticaseibacillus sp. GG6-2]